MLDIVWDSFFDVVLYLCYRPNSQLFPKGVLLFWRPASRSPCGSIWRIISDDFVLCMLVWFRPQDIAAKVSGEFWGQGPFCSLSIVCQLFVGDKSFSISKCYWWLTCWRLDLHEPKQQFVSAVGNYFISRVMFSDLCKVLLGLPCYQTKKSRLIFCDSRACWACGGVSERVRHDQSQPSCFKFQAHHLFLVCQSVRVFYAGAVGCARSTGRF